MSLERTPLRVLVVEDDVDHREALLIVLGALDIVGSGLADGEEAVDHVVRHQPQLVLMDIAMPRVDGIEATRRIRAADIPQPHIIIVSGHIDPTVCSAAFDAGCDEFLLKGDMAQLRTSVRALQRRSTRRRTASGTHACTEREPCPDDADRKEG